MDPKIAKAALDALKNNDQAAALALVEQLVESTLTGGEPDGDESAMGDEGATAENADVPPPPPGSDNGTGGGSQSSMPPAPPGADEQKREREALGSELVKLSGRGDAGEALAYFRGLHETATRTSEDAAVLEAGERRELVAELVKLGAEVPALAWKRDDKGNIPDGAAREPVKRLAEEPIAELRSRVTVLRASRGKAPLGSSESRGHRAPPTGGSEPRKLSKAEEAYCKKEGISPEEFRARVAGAAKRSK